MKHFNIPLWGSYWLRKRWRIAVAVFAPLCAAAVVLTIMLLLRPVLAASGDPWDCRTFASGVTIKNLDGTPLVGNAVVGTDYKVLVPFKEFPSGAQFAHNGSGVMLYQLPPEIQIPTPSTYIDVPIRAKAVPGGGQIEVGQFSIDDSGLVTVEFFAKDANGDPSTDPPDKIWFDYAINCFFDIEFQAHFTQAGGPITIDIGDNAKITLEVDQAQTALALTKTASHNAVTETIDYTVTLTAVTGDFTSLTFADQLYTDTTPAGHGAEDLGAGAHYRGFLKDVQVTIPGVNGGSPVPYTLSPSHPGAAGTYSWGLNEGNRTCFFLNIDPGIALIQGQSAVITYTMDYGEILDLYFDNDPDRIPFYSNDLKNRGTYTLLLQNHVFMKGLDDLNADRRLEAYTDTIARRDLFEKEGSISSDGKTINWKANVGWDRMEPLNGAVITDTLGAGLTFTDPANPSNNTTVTIQYFTQDDDPIAPSTTLTASGISFIHTVPDQWDGQDIYRVEFTYACHVVNPGVVSPLYLDYENNLSVTTYRKDASEWFHFPNPVGRMRISKGANYANLDGSPNPAVKWTFTWDIPAGFYGQTVYLNDAFYENGITNTASNLEIEVQEFDSNNWLQPADTLDSSQYSIVWPSSIWHKWDDFGSNDDYFKRGWTLVFNDAPNTPPMMETGTNGWNADGTIGWNPVRPVMGQSLSPYQYGARLTLTFETRLDTPISWDSPNSPGVLEDYLRQGNDFYNFVNVGGSLGGVWQSMRTAETAIRWPISKTATQAGDGMVSYKVTLKVNGSGGLDWVPDLIWGPDPVFTDTFDNTLLEYVPNSFFIWYNINPEQQGARHLGPYRTSDCVDMLTPGNGVPGSVELVDNGDGYSTITIHLKDLAFITDPNFPAAPIDGKGQNWGDYVNKPVWIGPPAAARAYDPAVDADENVRPEWWLSHWPGYYKNAIQVMYCLKLKAEPEEGESRVTGTVHNQAGLNSVTKDHDFVYDLTIIDKEMVKDTTAGNKVNVSVKINEGALTLAPENTDPDGLIELVDTMSDTLAMFLDFAYTLPNGADTPVPFSEDWPQSYSYKIDEENNKIHFMIPDETYVVITYSCLVKGGLGDNVDIENTVSVAGKYEAEVHDLFTITAAQGSAGLDLQPVTLIKRDALDQRPLEGAVFALYADTDFDSRTPHANDEEDTYIIGGSTFYYLGQGATASNGRWTFSSPALFPEFHAIYAIVELEAPSGYLMPAIPYTLFSFEELAMRPDVRQISDYITAYNTRSPAKLTLNARKTATGKAMEEGQFGFVICDSNSDGDDLGVVRTGTNALGGPESAVNFPPFSYDQEDDHYYLMKETSTGGDGWTTSSMEYLIKVAVTDHGEGHMVATATYGYRLPTEQDPDPPFPEESLWDTYAQGTDTTWPVFNNRYEEPGIPFRFRKTDRYDMPLAGVEFKIFACGYEGEDVHTHTPMAGGDAGCCWVELEENGTATSNSLGVVDFGELLLPTGEYRLVETKTNPGFQLPLGQWRIQVDTEASEGERITITAVSDSNTPPPAFAPDEEYGFTVINYPIFTMPRAGISSYTALLCTAGGMALVGAAAYIGSANVRMRRKKTSV